MPIRATTPEERERFHCPAWCKGYITNPPTFSEVSLDIEAILRKYKQGTLLADSGGDFLQDWIAATLEAAKTPKGLDALVKGPLLGDLRQPYGKPI